MDIRNRILDCFERSQVALSVVDIEEIRTNPVFDINAWFVNYNKHEEKIQKDLLMRMIHLAFDPCSVDEHGENIFNMFFSHLQSTLLVLEPKTAMRQIMDADKELVTVLQGMYVALSTYNNGEITQNIEEIIRSGTYKDVNDKSVINEETYERGVARRLDSGKAADDSTDDVVDGDHNAHDTLLRNVKTNQTIRTMKRLVANRPQGKSSPLENIMASKMLKSLSFLFNLFYVARPLEPLNKIQISRFDISTNTPTDRDDPIHGIGDTLYDIALNNNNSFELGMLLANGVPGLSVYNLVKAVTKRFNTIVLMLLVNGILPSDAEAQRHIVSVMMHATAANASIGLMNYLLTFDFITETLKRDIAALPEYNNRTFFHSACLSGDFDTMLMVLRNAQALGLCRSHPSMFRLLRATDSNGYTPLHYSCLVGSDKVTEFLLMCGANPNVVNTSLLVNGEPFSPKQTYAEDVNDVLFDLVPLDCALVRSKSPILDECKCESIVPADPEASQRRRSVYLLIASGAATKPQRTSLQKTWELAEEEGDGDDKETGKSKGKPKKPIKMKKNFVRSQTGFSTLPDSVQAEYLAFASFQKPYLQKRLKEGMTGTFLGAYISKLSLIWTLDTSHEAQTCHVCQKAFSAARRRHHCRRCGEVICSSCLGRGDKPEFESIGVSPSSSVKSLKLCFSCSQGLTEDIVQNKQTLKMLKGKGESLELIGVVLGFDSCLKAASAAQLDPSVLDSKYIALRESLVRISLLDVLDENFGDEVEQIIS